jgi:hypothetical protein
MPFLNLSAKQLRGVALLILGALIVEFFILEGTIGTSLPSDRYHAISSVEIKPTGLEQHFITRNYRFSVVGSGAKTLVLREYFLSYKEDAVEGPPKATVTVAGMNGGKVEWTFREPGERGDVLTDNVYRVVNFGSGETGNVYTYFSLVDGRKVRTNKYVELSNDELSALDGSIAK